MTYPNRQKRQIDKVGKIDVVCDDDAEIADKVVYESVYNIISLERLGIQSTQNGFKLIGFYNSRRN